VILRFHEGTDLATAARRLSNCLLKNQELVAVSRGQDEYLQNYLRWVTTTEALLRSVFTDLALVHHLRTSAYWAIRNASFQPFRVIELINSELFEQRSWLEGLTVRLEALQNRMEAAPGKPTVVDTHVLLHYQPPEQVDWPTVVEQDEVRLVLPLRVVEELDEKKYAKRDDLADRARRLLSQLWNTLGEAAGGPVSLRKNVTIEVPVEDGPRVRTADADEEILDSCLQLRNVGCPPILVTGDTGMSLRAKNHQLDVIPMPDNYLRNRAPGEAGPGSR
jgi:uncharacterized coiled-coil protein SlyX